MASTTSTNVNKTALRPMDQPSAASSVFPLLRLPREIRQEILSYVVEFAVVLPSMKNSKKPFVVWWFDGDGRRVLQHSSPLYTCRLLYREGLPILRRVRYMVEDCKVATPLIKSMDENTKAVVRSISLNRASVEQKGMWDEVCQGLKKLELKDLQISVDGTEEVLKAMQMEGEVLNHEKEENTHDERTENTNWSALEYFPIRKISWVEDMLGIRGLRRLSVSIPKASTMENEVRSYLKHRTMGIQVG